MTSSRTAARVLDRDELGLLDAYSRAGTYEGSPRTKWELTGVTTLATGELGPQYTRPAADGP
jgi:hypothetical protein